MPSQYVDVTLEAATVSHCFWRGSSIEFAPKISKHRKRPAQSTAGEKFVHKIRKGEDVGRQHMNRDTDNTPAMENDVQDGSHSHNLEEVDYTNADQFNGVVQQLCEGIDGSDNDKDNDDNDKSDVVNDIFDELLQEFEEQHREGEEGVETSDHPENVVQSVAEVPEPVHPSELVRQEKEAEAAEAVQSDSAVMARQPQASSSSATASNTKQASSSSAPTKSLSIAQVGGRSASLFDDSTVFVGPFTIVKRYHPVPCSLLLHFFEVF